MVVSLLPETSIEMRLMARTVAAFRAHGRMDMAFGGPVLPKASGMQVTKVLGARTTAVDNLLVRPGDGIGGKAMSLRRPVSVTSYLAAQGITHVYDHAVIPEALETVAVLPIMVDDTPRMLVYLCSRIQVPLGDRWFDSFTPLIQRVERDVLVDEEVRRRMARLQATSAAEATSPAVNTGELRAIAQELDDLGALIEDEQLKSKIDSVRTRFTAALAPTRKAPPVDLSPREIEVLRQVARGLSNNDISDALGLLPNTVKTYVKTAMRKLNATNRVHATVLAREAGLIP